MENKKKRILWLSLHELTEEQKALLVYSEGQDGSDVEVKSETTIWRTTKDETSDNEANARTWLRLSKRADIVVGIFPPVSVVGLVTARGLACGDDGGETSEFAPVLKLRVITPVSVIGVLTLQDGRKRKTFKFLRWQEL